MAVRITFAQDEEEDQVMKIVTEYEMGMPGEIDEILIAKRGQEVLAAAKIVESDDGQFFLEVIGVKESFRSQGLGKSLLGRILENPWKCCKYSISEAEDQEEYSLSTLARGYAVGFYQRLGFRTCSLSEIPEYYREQCEECTDRLECEPMPMIYCGGNKK
ncbi:GNAT family N-acetyltransferase [Desulfitobacterium sp. THU1]|uniref:GNAT family N-acetyltransferase n=1 Tax=Desulfitobacterium sp. THU1 TaxID=3138072 RepID=UPI00311D5A07